MRLIQEIIFLSGLSCLYGNWEKSDNNYDHCYVSDAKTEEDVMTGIFPTTLDEREIFEYKGVPCDECNDLYDGPCPLHVLKYVAPRPKPSTYLHHRAERTAPKNIFKVDESSIPHSGAGLWTIKKIPSGVVFGPVDGKIREIRNMKSEHLTKNNETLDIGYYWKIPNTNHSYLDLLDKHRANFLSYVNCARNVKEENLVRYFNETDGMFYFKSKGVIPKYTELLADYGSEYRKTIGISDLDFTRPKELKKNIFVCGKCLQASYTPVDLMPHHLCPKPKKEDDPWIPILNNKTIVRKHIITHERENPSAFKTVWECLECIRQNAKNKTKKMNEKEMKIHYLRKHENITEFNSKTIFRDDYIKLNKLCNRFYKCNICANESVGLNWTITPLRSPESIEFEKFVNEFERQEKIIKEKNKEQDFERMEDVIMKFEQTEQTEPKLELTTQLAPNTTRKKHLLNKNFNFILRDDAQCHFRVKHMELCNVSDVRVMKYKGDPHECSLCGNKTAREILQLDHHLDFHLNFTEMFDRGLVQLDYRTKKFNEPYLENFNFSHIFCTKCNHYIDTDKNHEPTMDELLEHKLMHINLNVLAYNGFIERKRVHIVSRPTHFYTNKTYIHCQVCTNFTTTNKSCLIQHISSVHQLHPHNFRKIPATLAPKIPCIKCNETFHSKAEFISHMTFTHRDYYYCVMCGKTNYYRHAHQKHMVKKHNNSTAPVLLDDWSVVESLWTSLPGESPENEPTFGDSIFKVDNSSEYNSVTEPHILLRSLGN